MKAGLLHVASLLLFSAFAPAQTTPPSGLAKALSDKPLPEASAGAKAGAGAPDYSGESLVIERLDKVYEMAADGTGAWETTVAVRVQTDAGVKQLGVLSIPYASNSDAVAIEYARVRHKDGTVVETPVSGAMEIPDPVTQAAPFYSDLKQKQLPIRSLGVGDTLEWQAKVVRTKAEAPGEFWGQESFVDDSVVLSQTLELRVPKGVYVNVWSPSQKAVETTVGGERVFRWVSSQTKPTVGRDADAEREAKNKRLWTPEQEVDAMQGKLPDVDWTTFKSWQEVGAWYRGLEGDRTVPDAAIKAKVAELTEGKTTEEEKVRAVYGFVATQIRYIGVAFGVGRYQPHRAEVVLENQYGDCKDKDTLLSAMLAALGLHADAVLIGAGVRFNEAVPSPAAFNHLITKVRVSGQEVWLDSTAEVAPYRMLLYGTRDRQALVVPEVGMAQVERTPAMPPFAVVQTMHAEGTLDKEGTSNSRLVMTFRGDDEVLLRAALRQVSAAQYDQVVQQLSQNLGYAGTASHAEISRPDDTGEPLTISYDYKREKAGDWDNYRIIPQLTPITLPRPDEKTPPVRAIQLGVPRVETATSVMKLPEGWGAQLPEAVHAKSAYATYDETYRFDKGTLYAERRLEVLQDKVPVAEWKSYKKWADAVDLGNDLYVQLTGMAGKAAGGEATGVLHPEAQKLVADAAKAEQERNFDEAKRMLDKARELNGRQTGLWAMYAFLAFSRGEISEEIGDFQQELKFHPEEYKVYEVLTEAEQTVGRRRDAEETLKSWMAAQPENAVPTVSLMNMLVEDKKAAEAVSVGEAAVAKLPEEKKKDETLQLQLGRAQISAGMKDKGRATLVAVMQSTQSPLMMNDCAYELADAGLELAAADTATRTALTKMDEESKTWTLDESPQTLAGKTRSIVATWDTMGWVLFREGKLDEAESYLRASWLSDLSADGGEHLGDVLAKQGKKDEALRAYELGLAAAPKFDAMGVKKTPGEQELRLQERAAALRRQGAKALLPDAQKTLQGLRTVKLGAAKGMYGTAEYRMLLSDGTVEKVDSTGAKRLTGGEDRVKTMKLNGFWPAGSQARLVRSGVLNCHAEVCEMVLEP